MSTKSEPERNRTKNIDKKVKWKTLINVLFYVGMFWMCFDRSRILVYNFGISKNYRITAETHRKKETKVKNINEHCQLYVGYLRSL